MTRRQAGDLLQSRSGQIVIVAGIAGLFLALRFALLYARDPFFDELFTLWVVRQPVTALAAILRNDSGPPLYYLLARLPSVLALRWLSLLFATLSFALIVSRRSLGNLRFTAALLLAAYPAAVLYAGEARGYALAALFITIGVLALDGDHPFAAAIAFVAAAYTHYYGVLFFPVLLLRGRRGVAAAALAGVLFVPGFYLAFHQPKAATAWNSREPLFAPLTNLSFAIDGSMSTLPHAGQVALMTVALVVLAVAGARSFRFAGAVLLPVAAAMAFTLAGRVVYFPMRFESLVAVPLALWLASSLEKWSPCWRRLLAGALIVIGGAMVVSSTLDELRQPVEPCIAAAQFVHRKLPLPWPVVATGFCYVPMAVEGDRSARAFPGEQGQHPGWVSPATKEALRADSKALPDEFLWVGPSASLEQAVLLERFAGRPIFEDRYVLVALMRRRS